MRTKITAFLMLLSVTTLLGQNLILNGDFEDGSTPISGWMGIEVVDGALITYDSENFATTWDGTNAPPYTSTANALSPAGSFNYTGFEFISGTSSVAFTTPVKTGMGELILRQSVAQAVKENTVYTYSWDSKVQAGDNVLVRCHYIWLDNSYSLVSEVTDTDAGFITYVTANGIDGSHDNTHPDFTSGNGTNEITSPAGAAYLMVGFRVFAGDWIASGQRFPSVETTVWFDDISLIEKESLAIEDLNDTSISFFPNPATDYISVTAKSQLNKVDIFNIGGQLVKEVNQGFDNISVSNLTKSSIYFVKIYSNKGISTKKLIIQ